MVCLTSEGPLFIFPIVTKLAKIKHAEFLHRKNCFTQLLFVVGQKYLALLLMVCLAVTILSYIYF